MKFNYKISLFLSFAGVILVSLGLMLFPVNNQFSVNNIKTTLKTSMTELKIGQEVVVTLDLGNYNGMKKGYNAYMATLVYDKNTFEQVKQDDFVSLNDWEELEYNSTTSQFVAIKKAGSKNTENVVQIRLRVKASAPIGKTVIKVKNIVTSEGKKDVSIPNKDIEINITREQISSLPGNTNTVHSNINQYSHFNNKDSSKLDSTIEEENSSLESTESTNDSEYSDQEDSDNSVVKKEIKNSKIDHSRRNYLIIFVIIILFLLLFIIILYKRRKNDRTRNGKMLFVFTIIGLSYILFAGTVYAAYNDFLFKGELNGDSEINYNDLKLLQFHLIHQSILPDDVLENADMNSDGDITVTDLTLLVQKLENTLDYKVEFTSIKQENKYVFKNSEFLFKFKAISSYGAQVEKVKVNNIYYDVVKDELEDVYRVMLKSSNQAGLNQYEFSEVLLNNGKKVKVSFTDSIEILKEKPTFDHYRVEENFDDLTLNIMFDLVDSDKATTSANLQIIDDLGNIVSKYDIKNGSNNIKLPVSIGKIYTAKFNLKYNLTTDKTLVDSNLVNEIEMIKELQMINDYQFNIDHFVTANDTGITDTYFKNEKIKLYFESSNATKYVPKEIRINGKNYSVSIENNKFVAILPGFDQFGKKNIKPELITLSNGKVFELGDNFNLSVNIIKKVPVVSDLTLEEDDIQKEIKVNFNVNDDDQSLLGMSIILTDDQDNLLGQVDLTDSEIKKSGKITKIFKNLGIVSNYRVKVVASYSQTDRVEDAKDNVILYQKDFMASFKANILSSTSDKAYYEKGDNAVLTYKISTNGSEDIFKIHINGKDYTVTKVGTDLYQVVYKVSNKALVESINVTKVMSTNGNVATVSNISNIEILKDVPKITNYKETGNVKDSKVIIEFNVFDDDYSFIEGNAVLLKQDGSIATQKPIKRGINRIELDVQLSTSYVLTINGTYDRDSVVDSTNKITDTLFTKEIILIDDSKFPINSIRVTKDNKEAKYFKKNEKINLEFTSTNLFKSNVVEVTINGKAYTVNQSGDTYKVIVDGYTESGIQNLTISQVKLADSKELTAVDNNKVQIEILKSKPVINNYRVEEDINHSTVNIFFDVVDPDHALIDGNVSIIDKDNKVLATDTIEMGNNSIQVLVNEGENYKVKINADYNLTVDPKATDKDVIGTVLLEKDLQLNIDYQFQATNFKTYLDDLESSTFNKNQKIKIKFDSTNATTNIPTKIKIDGNNYDLQVENGQYSVVIPGFSKVGSNIIKIERISLSNGKSFDVQHNLSIVVKKEIPTISDLVLAEILQNDQVSVSFEIKDSDKTLTAMTINLLNDKNVVVGQIKLSNDEIQHSNKISKVFDGVFTSSYKVDILADYVVGSDPADLKENIVLASKEIDAFLKAEVVSVVSDKVYYEKGSDALLTYTINSNTSNLITKITINEKDYPVVKLTDGSYQVSYKLDSTSGVKSLKATKVTYSNDSIATINKTIKLEVLKDSLTIDNYKQVDDFDHSKVTLSFDVIDNDHSFISGNAILTKKSDNTTVTKSIKSGSNQLEFDVIELEKYEFVVNVTYDRDTNVLTSESDNKVIDNNLITQEIQLVRDYDVNVTEVQTSKDNVINHYFEKDEDIVVLFKSSNVTSFEVVEVTINGKKYATTKAGDYYQAVIPGFDQAGVKKITIEKVKLSNTKVFNITSNNVVQVDVLKDKPSLEEFSYEESNYGEILVKFNVVDSEKVIIRGKVIISNGISNIKEQDLMTGNNTVQFNSKEGENYSVKVVADYDLDSNQLDNNSNYYQDVVLLENEISLGKRQLEIKDIISSSVYKQTDNGVEEVSTLKVDDLKNLSDYIVKVNSKEMPTFYTTIKEYRVDHNKLKLTLDYDNVVQYIDNTRQNKLEIDYGTIKDGVAQNISFESLVKSIEKNPSGTFELLSDVDASSFASNNDLSIITEKFTGTFNGNGYKIYNMTKPLFNEVEGANIKNLILSGVKLSGANSRGSIANLATDAKITNVHIKGLDYTTGANHSAGVVGEAINTNIEKCSVTNFSIITSGHIRVSAIVGKLTDGTIKNCYVEGKLTSTQSKDGNGIGGVLGHGYGMVNIENCISKIEITNNKGPRLNGAIVGLFDSKTSVLKNNVSLSTGTNFYSIHGNEPNSVATNNYELKDSGLASNESSSRVVSITQKDISRNFYKNMAKFDEDVWDLTGVSYDKLPLLKNDDPNAVEDSDSSNSELYIPDYVRIQKVYGYSKEKDILYHNLNQLMPYYDAKYLVEDGSKIANTDVLGTKVIRYIMPYSNGKLLTYLTSENYHTITDIKVVFDDFKISSYKVNFEELNQNISIYKLDGLDIYYAPNNYIIKNDSSIVNTIKTHIEGLDYATVLDPLTEAADARHYRDHYNEVIKSSALNIALQILQNDKDSILTINNEILNQKIKEQLIDGGKLNRIVYAYNYYYRWYSFEIGGAKVSDILLFEGKMFKDISTLDRLVNEVFVGNIGVNVTDSFFKSNISKYTGSSELKYFLDYIITNIGGYADVNDWFTEYFGARNILAEFGVDKNPDILYRAWYQIKKNSRMILPIITLPADCTYIISGPAHLQIGPSQLYHKDVNTAAGKAAVQKIVNDHLNLVKRHLNTLAGSFDPGKWNNYCIMVYDCTRIITGYKNSYFPGTNIVIGTSPVYTQGKVGQNYPFFKNFSEVLGLWQPGGSAAGVGNTAGFLWFIARPGLTNFDTWTHEFEHALFDKIMLFQAGTRFKYGLETLTEGNVEQNGVWSENNLVQDVGPYYFNTTFDLNKEGNATQNLSPDRIDTREKLENYFKGQQNALDLLDYIEGKAFIRLTPEQQARVATRMNQSGGWSTWGAITAAQAEQMNLTSLESLYDNRIIIRPENAWGVSVRGLKVINSIGTNDYGFESVWVNRWYIGHNDNGMPDAFSAKRNYFEMLGYAGVDGYVTYGRGSTKTDLDAIQKITKSVTGTAMNWKEYKMSRYATVEENIRNNKYIDVDYMIERFYQALSSDTNRNATSRTNLRKIYYHYLKSVTNDFVDDPLGTTVEVNHIKTAEELVEKINAQPYGYYVLDNDIDFSHMTTNVTQTFMGRLDGNGHKIIGNTLPIFNKIRYGYVGNIHFENTNIPKTISNAGALSYRAEMSTVEKINATNLQMNFGGRNDLGLIGGAVSNVITRDCSVEKLTHHIRSIDDIAMLNEDSSGIYILDTDLDFTGKTYSDSVVTSQFTGKIEGNGHTISNLTNASLFADFRGTIENLNINHFSNTKGGDFVAAFAKQTYNSTVRNVKFNDITLSGGNNVAVLTGMDGRDNANSTFEGISVKNAKVTGTGVYVSVLVGRKFGGIIRNVYVDGTLEIHKTECGGILGASQQNVVIENIVSNVNVKRPSNGDSRNQNGGFVGNIYNSPTIKNVISIGNVTGFTDNNGNEINTYKFTGATDAIINEVCTNCYEVKEATGISHVTDSSNGHLNEVERNSLRNKAFYKDNLHFDETIWNLDLVSTTGYPELR